MEPAPTSAALDALVQNEGALLRALIDSVPDPVFCKDTALRFRLVNRAGYLRFGQTEERVLGKTVWDIPGLCVHAAEYEAQDLEVLRSGNPVISHEEPFVQPDGTHGWFLTSKFPLRDEDGAIIGIVGIAREITLRKNAERRLAEERHRLETLIDAIPDPLFFKDCAGVLLHTNRAFQRLLGDPKLQEAMALDDFGVLESGKPSINEEKALQLANQTVGHFLITRIPLRDMAGEIAGMLGIARDITALKNEEEELARAQQRLIDHVENSPLAVIEWDADFKITRWAGQAQEIFGWTAEEVVGRHFGDWEFVHPEDAERVAKVAARLTDGRDQRNHLENRNLTRSGEIVHCVWQNSVLRDRQGRVESMLSLVQNITPQVLAAQAAQAAVAARQAMERKLLEAQKLETLGVLAGGVAHDFNNLLTGILGNATLARQDLGPASPVQPFLVQVERAALRAADLCRQMLAYSGQGRFQMEPLDLNQLIAETADLLNVSINRNATLTMELAPDLPAIAADSSQLQQIVMNLVINASEAVGEAGGHVVARTGLTHPDRQLLASTSSAPDLEDGEYVFLEVSDDGCGMTPEVLERIFDPFFTTKFTGRGLGLAAVLGIVRGHGGALVVQSEVGQGTVFRVLLPKSDAAAKPGAKAPAPVDEWQSSGTVLVVDDEEGIRTIVSRYLDTLGLGSRLAATAMEAVEIFAEQPRRITLVLLDLTMPQISGDAILQKLREMDPTVPVLLMSGFHENMASDRMIEDPVAGFLQKPFTLDQFREQLRAILSA